MRPLRWAPQYTITPTVARALMEIEAARVAVDRAVLAAPALAKLQQRARIRSTHYSTRIEGNRLTLVQTAQVVSGTRTSVRARERDVLEVKRYWDALAYVEGQARRQARLTEELIRRLYAIVERGPRAKPTPYRTRQNAVRDATTGRIVFLPPEADDVPALMGALVRWIELAGRTRVPAPIIAGFIHYQFVTIHPYYDGNGRTARLLTTFLLQREGYGLRGLVALAEEHARDLQGYYAALVTHPHHNYYEGRASADLTSWIEYFVLLVARASESAQYTVEREAHPDASTAPAPETRLPPDPRTRAVLALFADQDSITTKEVAAALRLSDRMARNYLTRWVASGWLVPTSSARKNRAYRLTTSAQ